MTIAHNEIVTANVKADSVPWVPFTGTVIGHTMKGAWRYLEHDWVSEAGDTVYETAASSHIPASVGDQDAEVFFVIVGELLFLDEEGNIVARENWKTSIERYEGLLRGQRHRGSGPDELRGVRAAEEQLLRRALSGLFDD